VDDDWRKQERKTPAKGSVGLQKVNNFPSWSHDALHTQIIQVYKTNKQIYYYQELHYIKQDA